MDFELGRYARHRLLDWFDQDDIASVHALVVGVGAIGNEVLKNLALLGVRNLTVVDMDHIEIHNLTRSVLFRETDLGRSKVEVAADRVRELLPEAEVKVIEGTLEDKLRPSLIRRHDVVFSCLDSFEARLALDEMCRLAGTDMVSGAIDARYSTVEFFPYKGGAQCGCYTCNLPPGAFQRIAQRYSCGWLRRVGLVERKIPTTIITSTVVASMMVSWGLRLGRRNTGSPQLSARLLSDTFTGLATYSDLSRNDFCPSCSQLQRRVQILSWEPEADLSSTINVRALKVRMPAEIVFSAQCVECGFDASGTIWPGSRLRSYSTEARRCPSCQAEAVLIDARDASTVEELIILMNGRKPDVPYLLVDIGETTFCLETRNE